MFEERNERGSNRHDLLWRHVDEVNLCWCHRCDVSGGTEETFCFEHLAQVIKACCLRRTTHENALVFEGAVCIERCVRLGDDVVLFFVGSHVHDFVRDLAVLHTAIWALDETELIDASERAECTDKTDVRTFRSLNRAHTAVVREVDVADFEARALTGQTTRSESRETAAVGKTRQRVDLVHELRQLRRSKELLDGSHDRANVDEGLRCDCFSVLSGHALANDALHS